MGRLLGEEELCMYMILIQSQHDTCNIHWGLRILFVSSSFISKNMSKTHFNKCFLVVINITENGFQRMLVFKNEANHHVQVLLYIV